MTTASAPSPAPPSRQLRVRHETSYRYAAPVTRSTHALRLRPVTDPEQTLNRYNLEVTHADRVREFDDVFGNHVFRFQPTSPFDELRVVAESQVFTQPLTELPREPGLSRPQIPLVWMPWQRQMMMPYLLPDELSESELEALTEYAMSFVRRNGGDVIDAVLDMNWTIHREFAYVSGSTTMETTPYDVLQQRRGVCQDFANLLICLARLLSIPARYRVGYIFTGGRYANEIQSDASHAWAELYFPWVGWRGFDPTNGCVANADHVRVAVGRHFRDATPTGGVIYEGGGGELLTVDVRVELDDSSNVGSA